MCMKPILILLFPFSAFVACAQPKVENDFAAFAKKQDSLMTAAYYKKDTTTYKKNLEMFLSRYKSLDSTDKKNFSGYYYNSFYNLACTYSLLNNKPMAIEYFSKAVNAGFTDYYHILGDSDLNNIRNEDGFKTTAQSLRRIADYLYILKNASAYNNNDTRQLPAFTYQAKDNENLMALRKVFNLDSVAGTGNDISQIINLMHWIHDLIPHDGNHDNPTVKNAMSMIAECKKDNRGLNCRGLATVLNECYLSMGFKSRFVTCLPKDSLGIDNDCHVITIVYAPSLKKWIWIDPTFDAYLMNEKGELLSIQEVRERIINNEPLILNPDANWNHKSSETKDYYLGYYMAKNLYRLECSASSEYDLETRAQGKTITYIQLLPLEYFKQTPDKTVSTNKDNGTTFIVYNTNNADAFWQIPQ
jgi:hypothetical protein